MPHPVEMWDTFRSVVRFRPVETSAVQRRLRSLVTVDDYRRAARRRLPVGVFDYIDGGAGDERTMARNATAFGEIEFQPRTLVDVSAVDVSTELFGRKLSMPLILAPTGYTRLTHSAGEYSVVRAAARADIPYSLSTMSTRSIEDVAAAAPSAAKWFQVYTWRNRDQVADMIARARAAGYEALILTVDTAVLGNRERDARRGFSIPPAIGPRTIIEGAIKPAWTWDFLTHEPIVFANVVGYDVGESGRHQPGAHRAPDTRDEPDPLAIAQHVKRSFDQSLNWDDVAWLRTMWDGPIILKGIQSVEDARRAVDAGVEGISISNHGGRQLDDAPVPIELVEPVAHAVGGRVAIICDGGVRRGSDVVKALALGADACSIGRPYLYAAAVGGEAGVTRLLDFFRAGIHDTMALCGRTSVADLDPSLVRWRN